MGLRAQAEADLAVTLEAPGDFGDPITLTDPDGFESVTQLYGATADIGLVIDPETGQAVSGRHATVSLRISTLVAAGYATIPEGIADAARKPWLVEFTGQTSPGQKFKVKSSAPDRMLGMLTCLLEFYND